MPRDSLFPARAAFLWAFVFFVGLQLGLAVAIAVWLPGVGNPNYADKVERLRQHFAQDRSLTVAARAPIRIVGFGSSRTLFGLDAAGLGSDLTAATGRPAAVFNFGVIGAGPVVELLYLRKMLREGIIPDLVLIEVLPPFLAGQVTPPAEARWFLPCTRLPPSDLALLARYRFPTSGLRRTSWRSWVLPWYVHRRALLSRLGPSWLPYGLRLNGMDATDAAGWVALTSRDRKGASLPLPYGRGSDSNRDHFAACFEGFHLDGAPAEALGELLATCRRENIRAILVLMPETSLFRGWYPTGMEDQLERFLDRLGVPSIDARSWVSDAGFFDANHLHAGGAAILRRKLGRALLFDRGVE